MLSRPVNWAARGQALRPSVNVSVLAKMMVVRVFNSFFPPVIDCRLPLELIHGVYRLLNKTTYYNSVVSYECDPNYVLVGNRSRVCTEYGTWSNSEPTCERKLSSELKVLHRSPFP